MGKSFIEKEKGSALVFTILIIFILSVLGSVLISVAMTNFRLIRHGNDYNTAYYLADGAADEVLAEMDIITENAEYEALSKMSDHAQDIKDSYVHLVPDTDPVEYTVDVNGFINDMEDHYSSLYLGYLIDNIEAKVEDVQFTPTFNDPFEDASPVVTEMVSPASLNTGNLSDGSQIVIKNTGKYHSLQRAVTLTFEIHVPEYTFNATGQADSISYGGFERDNQDPCLELISWQETNIN